MTFMIALVLKNKEILEVIYYTQYLATWPDEEVLDKCEGNVVDYWKTVLFLSAKSLKQFTYFDMNRSKKGSRLSDYITVDFVYSIDIVQNFSRNYVGKWKIVNRGRLMELLSPYLPFLPRQERIELYHFINDGD